MTDVDWAMYTVTVRREFIAQHFLTVPNPGPEGDLHSHAFTLELSLSGPELNQYGYLVDIDRVNAALDEVVARYRDATLNDLPEFAGENPSVEHFARHVADRFLDDAGISNPERLEVRLWEDDTAWASYETPV
jgi:6-pyruvoyltetrahydropterin/6-carboxytetrahydropterin synthase